MRIIIAVSVSVVAALAIYHLHTRAAADARYHELQGKGLCEVSVEDRDLILSMEWPKQRAHPRNPFRDYAHYRADGHSLCPQ